MQIVQLYLTTPDRDVENIWTMTTTQIWMVRGLPIQTMSIRASLQLSFLAVRFNIRQSVKTSEESATLKGFCHHFFRLKWMLSIAQFFHQFVLNLFNHRLILPLKTYRTKQRISKTYFQQIHNGNNRFVVIVLRKDLKHINTHQLIDFNAK